MDKYKKYFGLLIVIGMILLVAFVGYSLLSPTIAKYKSNLDTIQTKTQERDNYKSKLDIVNKKIQKIRNAIHSAPKKIYAPTESDLEQDTLFFTLYNDIIELVQANSLKIKSINYTYNPEEDMFIKFGKDAYFVCDLDLELVSNYVNLGKLIQDLYQYPYYIKFNGLEVKPYEKDKKILISNLKVRLYARTSPETETR